MVRGEISNFVKNNVAVWMFNGETDGNNPAVQQDVAEVVKNLYREAGKSEEWIDEPRKSIRTAVLEV